MRRKSMQPIMRILIALLIVIFGMASAPISPAFAAVATHDAGAGANSGTVGATWTNPENITTDNNQNATVELIPAGTSRSLHATSFGFAIPDSAFIDGIQVTVSRLSYYANTIRDYDVRLLKAGAIVGNNKASTTTWLIPEYAASYGGPSDRWSTTWTPAEINDPEFGLSFQVTNVSGSYTRTASVDYVRITVTYTYNDTTLTVSSVSGVYGENAALSATLSPALAGRTVAFTLNGAAACSGTTDASGVAACDSILDTDAGSYPTGVAASFAGGSGYAPSSDTDSLTIDPRAITVTAVTDTKVYDGSTDSSGEPVITGELAAGDTAAFVQTFDNADAGKSKVLTPSGSVDDGNEGNNYDVTLVTVDTGEITPLDITVTADDFGKTYGDADPPLTYTSDPKLIGEDTFTGTLVRVDGEDAGVYAIEQGSLELTGNYNLSFVGGEFTIDPRTIIVTAVADVKVYDGSTGSSGVPSIAGTLRSGDIAQFVQTFDNANTGTDKVLTPSGSIDDGNNGDNYTIDFETVATGEITPLNITVTAVTDTKVYDGTPDSSGVPVITGVLAAGDTADFTQTFDDKHAGTAKDIIPTGSMNDGNGGSNYNITFRSAEVGTITPLEITVTAVPDMKVYDGTTASNVGPFINGTLVAGDTPAFTQAFDDKNAGFYKEIMPSGSVEDGNNGDNYDIIFQPTNYGMIVPSAITVTAVEDTKVYDGTTASIGVPVISGDLADGDTAGFIQTFDDANVGTEKVLTPFGSVDDGNDGGNYTVIIETVETGVINPLAVTVTADDLGKPFGAVEPALTYTVNPAIVSGDVFLGTPNRDPGEDVGRYDITQGSLELNSNYVLTFVGATFTIEKADQTITVTKAAPFQAAVGSSFSVAATSSSGLAVSYSASGSCSNLGAVFTITGSGTCTVKFDQPGNVSYNAAEQIVRTVNEEGAPRFYIFLPITRR